MPTVYNVTLTRRLSARHGKLCEGLPQQNRFTAKTIERKRLAQLKDEFKKDTGFDYEETTELAKKR